MSRFLVVSGTGTDVGKTIVSAAIAANALAFGQRVAVVKPGQTGLPPDAPGDLAAIDHLTTTTQHAHDSLLVVEAARFPDPLAPAAAARVSGMPPLSREHALRCVEEAAVGRDLVVVEGAGGLLVDYSDDEPWTIANLAADIGAEVVLVVAAGLGTLHHTRATLEGLAARRLDLAGLVIGSWPECPDLAARCNLEDLDRQATLVGALPAWAGLHSPSAFATTARRSLSPSLDGTFNAADFTEAHGWKKPQ